MSTKPISTPAVAGRLHDYGYTDENLRRMDETALAFLIAKAFEGERLGDLPASPDDFRAIRQHLDLIGRAAASEAA